MSSSITIDKSAGPTVFELDADFNISAVKTVGGAAGSRLLSLINLPFISLVPAEARGAAEDFFARLRDEQTGSTNQLFLQYPEHKSVSVDLLCRRIGQSGPRIWDVVVWNRERFDQTERELMLLYAVSSRINRSTDEFGFAEEVLFQIHNMMDVDASALMYLDQGRLRLTASRGLSGDSQGLIQSLVANLSDWQVDLYQSIDSADHSVLIPEWLAEVTACICRSSGCTPWLVVPLRTTHQFYGILGVARKSVELFSERERYLLMSLGRNLASASEKGRLFRRIKERSHKLSRSRRELRVSLARLELAHRELQHLDEMKKSFITLASHELQTPLTSIIGNAELMKKDIENLSCGTRNSLTEMLGGVDDLRARIEALMAANRVGSGLFVPRFSRCTIRQLFGELESEITEIAVDRALNLSRSKGGDCPDMLLDIELVKQALRMQLDNAIRHTPPGGKISLGCAVRSASQLQQQIELLRDFYPDVEERLGISEKYVLITVEDNGEGVADSEKLKIFTPFYGGGLAQHHSSRGFNFSGKGFGLGLSLARRIIEAHNGLLWLEDQEGGGSRFCQLLPQTT